MQLKCVDDGEAVEFGCMDGWPTTSSGKIV